MVRKLQTEVFASGSHIKWSVLWVKPKNGDYTIIRKEFGNDLTEALRVYQLAKQAKKPMATLRSNNVGFPAPPKLRPHIRRRKVTKEVVVLRRGKRVKKQKAVLESYEVIPMETYNRKGWWWCPYCREMRKFQRQSGFPIGDKSFVEAPGMYCPLCGVSHRDLHVRRSNPHADRMYLADNQPRRSVSTANSTRKRTARATSRRGSTT
jgi:hypothetical protein